MEHLVPFKFTARCELPRPQPGMMWIKVYGERLDNVRCIEDADGGVWIQIETVEPPGGCTLDLSGYFKRVEAIS